MSYLQERTKQPKVNENLYRVFQGNPDRLETFRSLHSSKPFSGGSRGVIAPPPPQKNKKLIIINHQQNTSKNCHHEINFYNKHIY